MKSAHVRPRRRSTPSTRPPAAALAGLALAWALSLAGCAGPGGGAPGPAADGTSAGLERPPAPAPPGPAPEREAREAPERAGLKVLLRFCDAAKGARWPEAWGLLSARWRTALTPEQLAADWAGAGPMAREAAERVEAQVRAGVPLTGAGRELQLRVAPGRAARLLEEGGAWRVDALE